MGAISSENLGSKPLVVRHRAGMNTRGTPITDAEDWFNAFGDHEEDFE